MSTEAQGVIHDIGYRHYEGQRLGRGQIVRALYLDSLRGVYGLGRAARSKVVPMGLFAVMCLPALVIVVIGAATHSKNLAGGGYSEYVLNTQLLIEVFLAAQAPVVVSRDLRFRVMSLYLSRPLRRDDYVLAKVGAFASAVFVLVAVPLTIMFIGALLARMSFTDQASGYLRALGGAVLFSLLLSVLALAVAAVTPRRGIGIASIITLLLVLTGVSGITMGLADERGNAAAAGYFGMISPFSLVQGVQAWAFRTSNPLPDGPPRTPGGLVFTLALVAVIAGCYGILMLRYRKVSVS